MRKILLDTEKLKTPDAAHDYLKEVFSFPSYYGRNLDALYDCLTDISEETEIVLSGAAAESAAESACSQKILRVICGAENDNPALSLIFEE